MEAPSKNAAAAEKNGAKINPKLVKAAPSHEVALKSETKRKGYLLVTMYRSGSTLTGEMFNRNPDFLYYFEPLAIFGNNNAPLQKMKMLNETFHCKAPDASNYKKYANPKESTTTNCLNEGVCMYQLSTRFCKPPFCWNPDAPPTQCKKQCSSPGADKAKMRHMERICKEEVNTVAIKTIRFLDLKRLHPFYADSYPIDFKAVLLVRDPRSMYHSRKKIHLGLLHGKPKDMEGYFQILEQECELVAQNLDLLSNTRTLESRKTFSLRYEDIARDPIKYSKAIYNFLGEEFNEDVSGFLHDAIAPPKKKLDQSKATYTTSRAINETTILNGWRLDNMVTQSELNRIQLKCEKMMKFAGYLPIKQEQKKDLSFISVDVTNRYGNL